MKVTNLVINGYQGVNFLALDLESPITLVAGKNGTGKTTIRDAIQFAITGESSRVKLKKDYDQLVRRGSNAKEAFVSVSASGFTWKRSVVSGKTKEDVADFPAILPLLLGNASFAEMTDKDKSATLYASTKIRRDRETVKQMLLDRKIDPECIADSMVMLNRGFEGAHKFCGEKKSECRGAWEAITKERFGTAKAADWVAPLLVTETLDQLVTAGENLRRGLPDLQAEADAAEANYASIARHNFATGVKYRCPECDAALIIKQRVLVLDDVGNDAEPPLEEQKKAMAEMDAAKAKLDETNRQIAITETLIQQARNAEAIRQEQTERARHYFTKYTEWDRAEAAYAPSGIPLQLLENALKPVNERLKRTSELAGWADIVIHPDLSLSYRGIPYGLCSESERWRVTAAITEALALMSGTKMFVLDRMDVLHPDDRGGLIKWLLAIAPEHDSIFVMATLKSPPTGLPTAIRTVWLYAGGDLMERAA